MTNEFWPAVILVLVTAITTGAVTLTATWQQSKIADRRRMQERKETLDDRRTENSRSHALALHSALEDLHELGRSALRTHGGLPPHEEVSPYIAIARRNYLLIDAPEVRRVVADGLTVSQNAQARGVLPADWREAVATTGFIVAAYLRGEVLPGKYVDVLAELRRRYPVPQ